MDTEGIQVVPPLLVQVAYRDGSRGGGGTNVVSAVDMLTRFGEQAQLCAMVSSSSQNGVAGTAATWALSRRAPSSSLGLAGAFVSEEYSPSTGFVSRPNVVMTNPSADITFQPAWRPAKLVWIRPEVFTHFFHDPASMALQEARLLLNTEFLGVTGGAVTAG